MEKRDEIFARCKKYPNAQSWVLDNVKRIKPIRAKGKLRLFDVNF